MTVVDDRVRLGTRFIRLTKTRTSSNDFCLFTNAVPFLKSKCRLASIPVRLPSGIQRGIIQVGSLRISVQAPDRTCPCPAVSATPE